MTIATKLQQIRCHIVLTNSARDAIKQHFHDEHALFNLQQAFTVYIEKESIENQQIHLTLFFDPKTNEKLADKFPERVVIMDCLFDLKSGLVAKSFRTRGIGTPVETNRREKMRIQFVATRINGHKYHETFIKTLANLPVSKDRYEYVNKRITSWEGYLKVLNKNASIDDIQAKFSKPVFSADFAHVTMVLANVDGKQWSQLKGLSARVRGMHEDIGEVVKVRKGERSVDIELKPHIASKARRNGLDLSENVIEFSNASTKSQLQRLLKGFQRLKEGLAANPNLETILFEDKPTLRTRKTLPPIQFHNHLNEFQRAAVTGAMEAEDLYVIQGPPGTGKTTVISEICTQNVRAGLKTLVASQSNLAVDNALSRLLSNKDIRILRYGRTESIEEEGKKFIEENVATYWKDQTYNAICNEISNHDFKEQTLRTTLSELTDEYEQLNISIEETKNLIEEKKEAGKQLPIVKEEIIQLKKQLVRLKEQLDTLEKDKQTLESKLVETKQALKDKQNELQQLPAFETLQSDIIAFEQKVSSLSKEKLATSLLQQIQSATKKLEALQVSLSETNTIDNKHAIALEKVANLKKVTEVEAFMEEYSLRRSFVMDRLLTALDRLQEQFTQVRNIQPLMERFQKAINYCRNQLQINVEDVYLDFDHSYTVENCAEFIELLSKAIATKKINASNGSRSVEGLHKRYMFLNQASQQYDSVKQETMIIFKKLKEEIAKQFNEQEASSHDESNKLRGAIAAEQVKIEKLEQEKQACFTDVPRGAEIIDADLIDTKKSLAERKEQLEKIEPLQIETVQLKKTVEQLQVDESDLSEQLAATKELLKETNTTGIEKEKLYASYEKILKDTPEERLKLYEKRQVDIKAEQARIETEIVLLPMAGDIQKEWKTMLEQATDYDLDEIRKLYVKHSNVIGTTCVASANKQFMDTYPTFDVVIIDEVSKATPPELLLPMLKGKKIILVGDHHQLPPLVGDETFEETLEQVIKDNPSFEQKRELEKLLEESLFERLYKNVSNDFKTMLGIQYRMHENIMKTIAPFYKNAQEELQCGLPDSDAARDHKLETAVFNRSHHLLWLDTPNKPENYEQRMKEGSSLFNEFELNEVKKLLIEMNEATITAISNGDLPEGTCKSVGVISYYAEQVKRINRLIEELHIPHLHIRTGSVDKFQGMEMDVIIVSMVRNHNGQGDIGFAKDYRRLNVALSRARELLICVGSAEMFTKHAKKKETRDMYQHVLDEVKRQDGYRLVGGAE